MPYKHNQSRRHKIEKARYEVTNWPEYNKALRQRGDITIWFIEEALAAWHPAKTGQDRSPWQAGEIFRFRDRNRPFYPSGLPSAATPDRRLHELAHPPHEVHHEHSGLQQHFQAQHFNTPARPEPGARTG